MLQQSWFVTPRRVVNPQLRIFCFPYAGGNANSYSSWVKSLPTSVELVGIQPPGRAARIAEPAHTAMKPLISDLLPRITDLLNVPYIFFGHSLGSRVAFELMHRCHEANLPLPVHFIASGSRSPDKGDETDITYNLPEDEFIKTLKDMNGTPEQILQNKELLELFIPLLRADFQLGETYCFQHQKQFNCPVTVFGGSDDKDVSIEHLNGWDKFFVDSAKVQIFPGGHFFIEENQQLVLERMNVIIQKALRA